jgi:8-amino-7-oxononanoate synthase
MNEQTWIFYLQEKLNRAQTEAQYRQLRVIDSLQPGYALLGEERYLNLSANDYLGLCGDPATREEARLLTEILPLGAGASRLITGTLAIHAELERVLAEWKHTPAALVFPSGYQTNVGLISALAGKGDGIFCDRLNHASIIDGCLLSGAQLYRYQPRDPEDLETQLKTHACRKRIIVTDGVFSMDGSLAPLPELNRLAKEYDALLIIDEAHATGVLGRDGAGTWSHFDLPWEEHVVLMGTLSKAVGVQGGFICGSQVLIDYLINFCRSFIYSTALSPLLAALAHYHIVRIRSEPERLKSLHKAIKTMRAALQKQNFTLTDDPTPIIPLILGDSETAVAMAAFLKEKKILALPIRPPTVPPGTSRLRISVSAVHTAVDLRRSAKLMADFMRTVAVSD